MRDAAHILALPKGAFNAGGVAWELTDGDGVCELLRYGKGIGGAMRARHRCPCSSVLGCYGYGSLSVCPLRADTSA